MAEKEGGPRKKHGRDKIVLVRLGGVCWLRLVYGLLLAFRN